MLTVVLSCVQMGFKEQVKKIAFPMLIASWKQTLSFGALQVFLGNLYNKKVRRTHPRCKVLSSFFPWLTASILQFLKIWLKCWCNLRNLKYLYDDPQTHCESCIVVSSHGPKPLSSAQNIFIHSCQSIFLWI